MQVSTGFGVASFCRFPGTIKAALSSPTSAVSDVLLRLGAACFRKLSQICRWAVMASPLPPALRPKHHHQRMMFCHRTVANAVQVLVLMFLPQFLLVLSSTADIRHRAQRACRRFPADPKCGRIFRLALIRVRHHCGRLRKALPSWTTPVSSLVHRADR